MQKKTFYVRDEQLEKLKLLVSVLPGGPDEAKLVREGIDLVLVKYLALDWVQEAIFERAKREERVRPVKLRDASGDSPPGEPPRS